MKHLKLLLVLIAVVSMTACTTIIPYSGDLIDLNTVPQKSVQATKKDLRLIELAVAHYRTGEYDDALAAIDRAIELKNYGTLGMEIRIKMELSVSFLDAVLDPVGDVGTKERTFFVKSVEKGGPADQAGIKVGDEVTGIGGIKIHDRNVISGRIKNHIEKNPPGTSVEVSIFRAGFFAFPEKKSITLERFKDPALPLKLGIKANILLLGIGNMEEAKKYATESLNSEQSNKSSESWAKAVLGRWYIDNGNYDEAIKLLSGIAKNSATVRLLEATAYAKQGNSKKAVAIYSAIPEEKLSANNIPLWSDRATLLVALRPYVDSKQTSAKMLQSQGQYQQALEALGDAITVANDGQGKEIHRGMVGILRAEPQLAELPEEARKFALRGDMLTERGDFKGAAKQYRQAVNAAPHIARLYFNTATVYGELQNYPQAIHYMNSYLQLAPDAPNARAAKDQIYKWEFNMEEGK